jgi:hypothetical protein
LPTPTRAAVKTYADAEWHRGEGEAAMVDPIEATERNPIEAWCNWGPECEAARPDEPIGAAQASSYRCATEASTDHRATDASTHPAVKASTKAVATTHTVSTGHSTAMSTSTVSTSTVPTSTVSAPAMSSSGTTTPSRCNSWGKSNRGTDCGGGGNGNKRFSKHGTVSS